MWVVSSQDWQVTSTAGIVAGVAPAVGDREAAVAGGRDAGDARPGRAVVQRLERGALRPMRHALGRPPPQPPRQLLDAAHHQALVLVAVGDDDAQDLQHRVGKVGVPAAGAEADLAEHLAMAEGAAGEGARRWRRSRRSCGRPRSAPARFQSSLSLRTSRARIASWMALKLAPSSSASRQASATSRKSGGRSSGRST